MKRLVGVWLAPRPRVESSMARPRTCSDVRILSRCEPRRKPRSASPSLELNEGVDFLSERDAASGGLANPSARAMLNLGNQGDAIMPATPRILTFAGSLRTESFNKKLARVAAEAARKAGGEVTLIDLRDYP